MGFTLKWPSMWGGLLLATTAFAQPVPSQVEIANLREDIQGLSQRVADLALRVEQLQTENALLRDKLGAMGDRVTTAQMNEASAKLNRAIQAGAAAKDDAPRPAAPEKHSRATGEAGAAHATATGFSDNFSKEGENYTVQKGDTLALIAKKTGGKVRDIINANRISDPEHIRAGQTFFIPGGK